MSSKTGTVRISAHIAQFTQGFDSTLEAVLRSISDKSNSWSDRVSERSDRKRSVISSFKQHPSNSSIGAVFSLYEPGSGKSTLVFGEGDGLYFNHVNAPNGEEFLEANIYLIASGNDLIIANIGNRSKIVANTILNIAKAHRVIEPETQMTIFDLPSFSVIDKIHRRGVKRVILHAAPMIATAGGLEGSGVLPMLFGTTNAAKAIEKRRNHAMKLEVWNTSRLSKNVNILACAPRDEWLDGIAEAAISDDNVTRFVIELNGGEKIHSDKISQSKNITVQKQDGVYNIDETHERMVEFLSEIKSG